MCVLSEYKFDERQEISNWSDYLSDHRLLSL